MQFTPENVERILAGTKTQTRRTFAAGDKVKWGKQGAIKAVYSGAPLVDAAGNFIGLAAMAKTEKPRVRWQAGKTYAIQPGRGKAAVARIRITEIRYIEKAFHISDADARAEGYEDADAFSDAYCKLNGQAADTAPCWALTFELAKEAGQA